jgi:hypothetical protein
MEQKFQKEIQTFYWYNCFSVTVTPGLALTFVGIPLDAALSITVSKKPPVNRVASRTTHQLQTGVISNRFHELRLFR